MNSVAGALQVGNDEAAVLLAEMERGGLVSLDRGRLRLRQAGRELALHVVRAHRLWESYLAEQTGVAECEWHHRAERQEHLLSPQEADALAARLGHPMRDPARRYHPEVGEDLAADAGQPLNAAPLDTPRADRAHRGRTGGGFCSTLCRRTSRGHEGLRVREDVPNASGSGRTAASTCWRRSWPTTSPSFRCRDCKSRTCFEEEFLSGLRPGQRGRGPGPHRCLPRCRAASLAGPRICARDDHRGRDGQPDRRPHGVPGARYRHRPAA